jgi:hypothetical protein
MLGAEAVPRRAFVLASGDETRDRAAVEAVRQIAEPAGRIVVAGRVPVSLGADLDVLREPLDRGTGVRLLVALALRADPRAHEHLVVSLGEGASGSSTEEVVEIRDALAVSCRGIARAPDQVLVVRCGTRAIDDGCMVVASAHALVELYRASFPCVLRLFEYVASLQGSTRSQHWDFVYRGLRTIDLWRDVLAPAEHLSIIRSG